MDMDSAIERLSNGTMLKQIAAEYGVSKVAVYKRLRNHPEYKDAIASQAHAFVEDAMAQVMECDSDSVNIARARVDAAFKYAKAHNPDYADKSHITIEVDIAGAIQDARNRALQCTIEGERTKIVDQGQDSDT